MGNCFRNTRQSLGAMFKRTRDVISHGYFEVDVDVIFDICRNRMVEFVDTVRRMRDDVASGRAL